MIIDSFDNQSPPITSREAIYGKQGHVCDTCIITFSKKIFDNAVAKYSSRKIAEISVCNGNVPIHLLEKGGKKVAFYLSGIGATLAGGFMEEANWIIGARRFIVFGSAGALDGEKTKGKYIVPTAAYRDEGMSYHYAPPADYIDIPGAVVVSSVMDDLQLPYVKGRCWTTDAFYRETLNQYKQRVAEGCLAVEMEMAGLQAVCDFYGLELYPFLMTGDVLQEDNYHVADLQKANHSMDNFALAVNIALRIASES